MSDKGTVSSKEKETTEKRGRGRPRKQAEEKASDVSPAIFFFLGGGGVMSPTSLLTSPNKRNGGHQQPSGVEEEARNAHAGIIPGRGSRAT